MKKTTIVTLLVLFVLAFALFAQFALALPYADRDGDGIPNSRDNCADTRNPDQRNYDRDSMGDSCDPDIDNDGIPNTQDRRPYYNSNVDGPDADEDGLPDNPPADSYARRAGNVDNNVAIVSVTAEANPTQVRIGETVNFNCVAVGGDQPLTYSWDFGDGSTAIDLKRPTHVYNSGGSFTATCTVQDSPARDGTDSERRTGQATVNVFSNTNPTVTCSPSSSSPNEGETIQLTINAMDHDRDQIRLTHTETPSLHTRLGGAVNPHYDAQEPLNGVNLNQRITWRVPYDAYENAQSTGGRYTIDYTASDVHNASATSTCTITVKNINQQCQDNADNDDDGLTDADDPGCRSNPSERATYDPYRNDESVATTQCQDTMDNDNDGLADNADPGCWTDQNNPSTYDRTRNNEANAQPQCSDGLDNDMDGVRDYPADFGCDSATDNSEVNNGRFQCNDGRDNNGNSLVDQADPGCTAPNDDSENRAPTLSGPIEIEGREGEEVTFIVTATDPDGDNVTFTGLGLLAGAVVTDNHDNTATFSWRPAFGDAGDHTINIQGDDGHGGQGVSTVRLRILPGNRAPEFTSPVPPAVTGNEDAELSFRVVATDADGESVTVTATDLPDNANYVPDAGNPGSGTFTWTPDYDFVRHDSENPAQNQVFVSFRAVDSHTPAASRDIIVTITVNDINREATITSAVVTTPAPLQENQPITIHVTATDPDTEDTVIFTPDIPGASVTQINTREADITFTPGYDFVNHALHGTSIAVTTTITADDGLGRTPDSSTTVTYTVHDVNRNPTAQFTSAPAAPIVGEEVRFDARASNDPDVEDTLIYSWDFGDGSPTAAGDRTTHTYTSAGRYNVILTVRDQLGAASRPVSQVVVVGGRLNVTLLQCSPAVIGGTEQRCTLEVRDELNNLVDSATTKLFYNDTDGTPVNARNTCNTDAHTGRCTISYPTDVVVDTVGFTVYATAEHPNYGADLDRTPKFSYDVVPERFDIVNLHVYNDAAFTNEDNDFFRNEEVFVSFQVQDMLDQARPFVNDVTGTVTILDEEHGGRLDLGVVPGPNAPNTYYFSGRISRTHEFLGESLGLALVLRDSEGGGHEEFTLTIRNNLPAIQGMPATFDINDNQVYRLDLTNNESDVEDTGADLTWSVADVDTAGTVSIEGKNLILDFSAAGLAANTLDDVILTLTDSDNGTAPQSVRINVQHINRAPNIIIPVVPEFREGFENSFTVTATDVEPGDLAFSSTSTLPVWLRFTQNAAARTATFRGTPGYDDAGTYTFTVTATDSAGLTNIIELNLIVTETNRNPTLTITPPGDKTVAENISLAFAVSAVDPDGDAITLSAADLPDGATFDNTTGNFAWSPRFDQAGTYMVTFTATDANQGTATETITITVGNVNRAPEVLPMTVATMNEGDTLTVTVVASDPDGDSVTLTNSSLPIGATFRDNGDGTGTFTWTPDYTQAGTYTVTFTASDGSLISSQPLRIDVGNFNRAPILEPIGAQEVVEESTLDFTLIAHEPDGEIVRFSAANLPEGAGFDNTTGRFVWTPVIDQAGVYSVRFTASDGTTEDSLSDTETVTITVTRLTGVKIIATPLEGEAPLEVSFNIAQRLNEGEYVTSGRWNFGDGGVSTMPLAHHTYKDEGEYTVFLTATTNFGNVYTDTEKIVVSPEPTDKNSFRRLRIRALQLVDGEVYKPGDNLEVLYDIHNEDAKLQNLMATITVQDIDVRRTSRRFNLKAGQTIRDIVGVELPYDIAPGWYDLRFTLSNQEGFKRIVYREFYIE